ncbi:MAG: dockerin type I domain-containing protein [Isosphaeraceae bacterium]
MNPSNPNPRRRPTAARPCAEALETRSLMTGGAGNSIAILPGAIADAGNAVSVPFVVNPASFTLPKGRLTLGIDVAPNQGSTLQPKIASVTPQASAGGHHKARAHPLPITRGPGTGAITTTVSVSRRNPNLPVAEAVQIAAKNKTSGNFLLGFYLPGDANGDGKVDAADITAIKSSMNARAGDKNYSFDADANRDGRITRADLALAKQNLGVKTTISPIITADIDQATLTAPNTRTTALPDVHFTGEATPGAALSYAEINNKAPVVSTTADANGQYSLVVHLGPGVNTFKVTSVDSFGQTISGTIAPVVLDPNAVKLT